VTELKGIEGTRVEADLHDGTQSTREGVLNSTSHASPFSRYRHAGHPDRS
jgi:hypothetical protein